jgi:N-acetylneuraminate synthase
MKKFVDIGGTLVGDDYPCFIVAEIGINHNGSLVEAFNLISKAAIAGCDAVKFQKRTVDVVYTKEELDMPRESKFGNTNGDLKRGLEFSREQYKEIDRYCKTINMMWFASCWDEESVDFIDEFDPPCYKIASASLTDDDLLRYTRSKGKPIILSTGMSTEEQIEHAVDVLGKEDLILLHCTSTYPCDVNELNLNYIPVLKDKFNVPVGYSGHEVGLSPTIAASVLGACMVERHITSDRSMWGSDQASSVEPHGFAKIVRDIHILRDLCMGDGVKRVYDSELPIIKKLRRK